MATRWSDGQSCTEQVMVKNGITEEATFIVLSFRLTFGKTDKIIIIIIININALWL